MNTRQQMILQMVTDRGRMNVVDLARMTGVSEVTIRHDLNLLEKENFLRRAHGYAVPLDSDNVETRMMNNYPLKRRLAEYAASLVDNGETVFIENGSCNALLARTLAEHKSITLITVSAYIAHLLKDTPCEVVLLGGVYQKQSESMVGPLTRNFIQQVHFTKAFIGADGWLPNTGFTGRDMLRSEVVNTVLEKNVQSIVLTDSSKFGCLYPYGLGPDSALRRVITDSGVSDDIRQQLENRHEMVDIVPALTGE